MKLSHFVALLGFAAFSQPLPEPEGAEARRSAQPQYSGNAQAQQQQQTTTSITPPSVEQLANVQQPPDAFSSAGNAPEFAQGSAAQQTPQAQQQQPVPSPSPTLTPMPAKQPPNAQPATGGSESGAGSNQPSDDQQGAGNDETGNSQSSNSRQAHGHDASQNDQPGNSKTPATPLQVTTPAAQQVSTPQAHQNTPTKPAAQHPPTRPTPQPANVQPAPQRVTPSSSTLRTVTTTARPTVPSCAASCVNNLMNGGATPQCKAGDFKCYCNNSNFWSAAQDCGTQSCEHSQSTRGGAMNILQSWCNGSILKARAVE